MPRNRIVIPAKEDDSDVVSARISRSFAGNIPVNRDGHPNDTLFFWAFEKSEGSLTVDAGTSDDPWIIWLNGGYALYYLHSFWSSG